MKKLIAMLLALVMVLVLAACGGNNNAANGATDAPAEVPTEEVTEAPTEEVTDAPVEDAPQAPVEETGSVAVLNNIWNLFAEDQKFPAMGGDMNNLVDGKPGKFDHTDLENLSYQLLVPADQAGNIDDAAGMFHGMMLNNFTAGAFHVTGDVKAFADAMYGAVANNQWMCGFPEQLLIAVVDGENVVMVYGLADLVNNFATHMAAAYPAAEILYQEAIVA